MQHLFQSPFLQALGYAITNSLWQAAFVWLVFILLNSVLRLNAAARYKLAVGTQLVIFTWFLLTLQFYTGICNARPVLNSAVAQQHLPLPDDGSLQSLLISWLLKTEQLLPYLSTAYLVLMCFLSIRWFMGYRKTQLIRRTGLSKMPAQWRLFTADLAVQLGISRKVQVFLSETIHTPLTIGFLKPLILIPVASINHLSAEQLEAVILHEMAHIKRYDYLLNMLLSVVEISLFFNPFTQLLSKQIKKERENSCDDWVLQFQYNAASYAGALLQIARLQSAPAAFAMAATGSGKKDLLGRVKRMLDPQENRFNYRRQLLAFCMVTLILSSIAWLSPDTGFTPSQQHKPLTQPTVVQPVAVEPVTIQVNNPLFNPVFFLSDPLKKKMKKDIELAAKEIHTSVKEIKEVTPAIFSSALQTASNELEDIHFNEDIFQAKKVQIDTTPLFASIRSIPKREELEKSFKNAKEELRKAQKILHKEFKMQESRIYMDIDEMKIQHDIRKAMTELEKLNLDKIFTTTLQQVITISAVDTSRHTYSLIKIQP